MKAMQSIASAPSFTEEAQQTSASRPSGAFVTTEYLSPEGSIPLVIRPASPNVDLVGWANDNRSFIDGLLLEHRALLFRGFQVKTPAYFNSFVKATSDGPLLEYKDRSTPRYEVGNGIYISTIYPPDQKIHPHNEGTYWKTWPGKIYFCCMKPSTTGGETPISDVRRVFERIDPAVREQFREKKVMYMRNYNPGIGLSWQDAFQTKETKAVEEYAEKNAIQIEWAKTGTLRTRQIRPAIRKHPKTGEDLWFNHGAFFHVSSLDPEVRDALLSSYKEEGLPYNTYFGDGTPISSEVVEHIREAYAAEQCSFLWQQHDVMLLDNMTVTHARESYTGERNVVVAMTEAHTD
ncbi:MAG: TauD/TfdA family dioxygenase [Candidatus Angelobacter sp.]